MYANIRYCLFGPKYTKGLFALWSVFFCSCLLIANDYHHIMFRKQYDIEHRLQAFPWLMPNPLSKVQTGGDNKLQIVVYTHYRSGSSFLTELFSQNPYIFATFEPLKLFSHTNYIDLTRDSAAILELMLQCNFSPMMKWRKRNFEYIKNRLSSGQKQRYNTWARRAFCSNRTICKQNPALHLGQLEQQCAAHKHVAAKIISLHNLPSLWPLINTESSPRRVVHLIRDVRGQISSMIKVDQARHNTVTTSTNTSYWEDSRMLDYVRKTAKSLCDSETTDVEYMRILMQTHPWLATKYTLVRYEDLAYHPIHTTRQIYEFLGIETPLEVMQWVKKATSKATEKKSDFSSLYETSRDSRQTAEAWRTHLPITIVNVIQEECAAVLDLMSYRRIQDANDLVSGETVLQPTNLFPRTNNLPSQYAGDGVMQSVPPTSPQPTSQAAMPPSVPAERKAEPVTNPPATVNGGPKKPANPAPKPSDEISEMRKEAILEPLGGVDDVVLAKYEERKMPKRRPKTAFKKAGKGGQGVENQKLMKQNPPSPAIKKTVSSIDSINKLEAAIKSVVPKAMNGVALKGTMKQNRQNKKEAVATKEKIVQGTLPSAAVRGYEVNVIQRPKPNPMGIAEEVDLHALRTVALPAMGSKYVRLNQQGVKKPAVMQVALPSDEALAFKSNGVQVQKQQMPQGPVVGPSRSRTKGAPQTINMQIPRPTPVQVDLLLPEAEVPSVVVAPQRKPNKPTAVEVSLDQPLASIPRKTGGRARQPPQEAMEVVLA